MVFVVVAGSGQVASRLGVSRPPARDPTSNRAARGIGGKAKPAGRSVGDVLDEWVKQNLDTWAPSSARDQQSRVRSIKKDQIARLPLARLTVADVERWHTRLRAGGMADPGIKNQHGVLRAALSQAVRWGWVSSNVASLARLRSTKVQQRSVMSVDEVRAVMTAAASIDAAAELALRIAAVSGARRAELAPAKATTSARLPAASAMPTRP